jgi:uncharacterized protein YecT (DUF1311 family)
VTFSRLIIGAFLTLPSFALAADFAKCNPSGSQLEMTACAVDDLKQADSELNEVYQTLLIKQADNKVFIQKLRGAQRAWVAFRDAELEAMYACESENQNSCWGSMLPLCRSSYMAKLTRDRTDRLRDLSIQGPPADQCH